MFLDMSSADDEPYSWAISVFPQMQHRICENCERRLSRRVGPIQLLELYGGSEWSDAIGFTSGFMVSERVVDDLRRAGIRSFKRYPIKVASNVEMNDELRALPMPRYFWLKPTGTIDIDHEATGLKYVNQCPVCLAADERIPLDPDRLVPSPETWDGSDIMSIRNFPSQVVVCTERVVLLARENRWTNFHFNPLDASSQHAEVGWRGVDYMGKQWPPKWYPDRPDKGKSLEEWLADFEQIPAKIQYPALMALFEIGQPAVPRLVELLKSESPKIRYRAAGALRGLKNRGVSIPTKVEGAIERELKNA